MSKKRAKRKALPEKSGPTSGLMGGMRQRMKQIAGTAKGSSGVAPGGKRRFSWLDITLWVVVLGLAVYLLLKWLGK